jgi:hypothetical protein
MAHRKSLSAALSKKLFGSTLLPCLPCSKVFLGNPSPWPAQSQSSECAKKAMRAAIPVACCTPVRSNEDSFNLFFLLPENCLDGLTHRPRHRGVKNFHFDSNKRELQVLFHFCHRRRTDGGAWKGKLERSIIAAGATRYRSFD